MPNQKMGTMHCADSYFTHTCTHTHINTCNSHLDLCTSGLLAASFHNVTYLKIDQQNSHIDNTPRHTALPKTSILLSMNTNIMVSNKMYIIVMKSSSVINTMFFRKGWNENKHRAIESNGTLTNMVCNLTDDQQRLRSIVHSALKTFNHFKSMGA